MRRRAFTWGVAGLVLAVAAPAWPAGVPDFVTLPTTSAAVRHDTSPALRDIPVRAPKPGPNRTIPNEVRLDLGARAGITPSAPDPLRQSAVTAAGATPQPVASFDGLSDDDNAAVVGFRVVPPDTEGDVGLTRYVQWINSIFAVYDKATGARVFGPVPGNIVWSGFGGICESNNDGDPIVLYDHLANRWVFSQFAIGTEGHQCVAVSTSGDPTGSYNRYDFIVSPGANGFNDYPKMGVWPDAYYLSANQFHSSFEGAIAVAFERDAMLAGQPARMVRFGPLGCGTECFFAIQPSHLEGPAPAPGTPNTYIMAFDDQTWGSGTNPDGYRLWDFHVDWTNPGNSTFTSLGQVNTVAFDSNLCNFNSCIVQPRPGERLDALGQFTMYRAQYRSFADHASIVISHPVDADGHDTAGVRWAELRNSGSGWSLFQTGTFSPDGDSRWLSTAAMDGAGGIAVGYSVASRNTFPSVRYATRSATDPLGSLSGEVELVAGAGVQQSSSGRWGDYAAISVDPVDDCTFWFTQEYYANSGSFDFKTRIGAFAMPECTGGPVCTPTESPEVSCNDGLDNDCDGLIDAADPDCQGGGGCTLGQPGDACTVNADCCSGSCKGKPGAKTCH